MPRVLLALLTALSLGVGSAQAAALVAICPDYCFDQDDWEESKPYGITETKVWLEADGATAGSAATDGTVLIRAINASPGAGADPDYRLQVWVQDPDRDGAGWAGRLHLPLGGMVFSCNRSDLLVTNSDPGCWTASFAQWLLAPVLPEGGLGRVDRQGRDQLPLPPIGQAVTDLGPVDGGPWQLPAGSPLAGSGAHWLWAAADPSSPAIPGVAGRPYAVFETGLTAVPVPEPGSALLAGVALLGGALARSARRQPQRHPGQ